MRPAPGDIIGGKYRIVRLIGDGGMGIGGWDMETAAKYGIPLVAVLWGRDAQTLQPLLGRTPFVASAHPSPLSAAGGFFGSRPFSRVNALLQEQGGEVVDWTL